MANPERWKRFADLPADLADRLERLPALFREREVRLAYVFGSLAEGDEHSPGDRPPGDVDLALLADGSVGELRADLHETLGTQRLDLVDLDRASPLLRFHVIRDGRLLYARDDDTINRFELSTLHLYRDTAPLRRRHEQTLRDRMNAWSLKREVVQRRLEELDHTLERLARHRGVELATYRKDLDLQWIVERGLLNAAGIVFDVADHVMSGHFGEHEGTYQGSLDGLRDRGVISAELHDSLEGLGGFRNLLVHEYLELDDAEVHRYLEDAFCIFPRFGREVLDWLGTLGEH